MKTEQRIELHEEHHKMVNEATTWEQALKIAGEAGTANMESHIKGQELSILTSTKNDQIELVKNEAILKGVEIKAREAGIKLTDAETKETMKKISKIVSEIERMKVQSENEKQTILQDAMQKEFNTSTPAEIKQWTDIGTDILRSIKK